MARLFQLVALLVLAWTAHSAILRDTPLVLNSGATNEWTEFQNLPEHRGTFELSFSSESNATAATILIHQYDVRHQWEVHLNGRMIGALQQIDQRAVQHLEIPSGALTNGTNTLRIQAPQQSEQIEIGRIEVVAQPSSDLLGEARVRISAVEEKRPIPCRFTIVDSTGALVPIRILPASGLALRTGVLYSATGSAEFTVRAGTYTIYASRGPEYSVASALLHAREGSQSVIQLTLDRKVESSGWIAVDTHIHTFTHSRHGDATIEERAVSIAGEGIEMPIATDHNIHISFKDAAAAAGVSKFFTPVTGNEVTTRRGHFNAFPIQPDARVPDFRLEDWDRLFASIRATPNVQFITMNHPTDLHAGFRPFASTNFNPVTGENLHGHTYGMNAIELINSAALQSDHRVVLSNWFALLNHGHRIFGVGASDSHEVSRFIVGQGRTYIRANDADPSQIDTAAAIQNLKAGRAIASMGLFIEPTINGRFHIGDLVTNATTLEVKVRVQGPAWAKGHLVEVFANGQRVHATGLFEPNAGGTKGTVTFTMPKPSHDVWLVAMARGAGQVGPFWALPKPYQATSAQWNPSVFAIANPIWIDADGDGKFTAARDYAARVVRETNGDLPRTVAALSAFDRAVAAHAASLLRAKNVDLRSAASKSAIASATPTVQNGFADYIQTIPEH